MKVRSFPQQNRASEGRPYSSRHTTVFFLMLTLLTVLTATASLCLGSAESAYVTPAELFSILLSGSSRDVTGRIILLVRLPRTLGALIAGAGIAVSGAVLQGVLANPLAAPGVIGIHAGAGLFVVLALLLLPAAAVTAALPFAAFAGALFAAFLVVAIAEHTGASRITIVLAGIAISYIMNGIIDAILSVVPDVLGGYSDFRIGGLSGLTLARIAPASAMIAAALIVLLLLTNELDILNLGEETASGLGLPVRKMRMIFLILAAALAGSAVSFCGMISFVGMVVPHICRRLIGAESRKLIPACILGGAFFLNFCDLLGRLIARPYEIPVGVILSLVGGPFFLALIFHQHRKSRA